MQISKMATKRILAGLLDFAACMYVACLKRMQHLIYLYMQLHICSIIDTYLLDKIFVFNLMLSSLFWTIKWTTNAKFNTNMKFGIYHHLLIKRVSTAPNSTQNWPSMRYLLHIHSTYTRQSLNVDSRYTLTVDIAANQLLPEMIFELASGELSPACIFLAQQRVPAFLPTAH